MNARYRSVRYSASGRFAVLLPAVFAAGWVALAASSSCFGAFGLTQVSTTGRYTAANPSPDRLTTTANNATLKVTGGAAQPVLPFDQGLVVYSAAASQNATAVFVNRSTGWGCFYSVNGVYVSSGGTGVGGNTNTWNSWFKDRNKPRIAVAVNGPGKSNNIVLLGPNGGTLYVSVLGATGNFQVSLSATPAGNGGGALSGLPASVSVTGGNSQTAVPLNGATPGAVTITASTTATVDGSPNTTISASTQAIVAGFNVVISPNDQFSGRSYTKLGVGETGLLQVVTAAGVTPQSLGPFTLVVDSPTTLSAEQPLHERRNRQLYRREHWGHGNVVRKRFERLHGFDADYRHPADWRVPGNWPAGRTRSSRRAPLLVWRIHVELYVPATARRVVSLFTGR